MSDIRQYIHFHLPGNISCILGSATIGEEDLWNVDIVMGQAGGVKASEMA